MSRLLQNHSNPVAGENFNPNSDALCHLLDDSTIVGMDIDSINNLTPDKRPQLKHVTNHAVRGDANTRFQSDDGLTHYNENYPFDTQEYLNALNQVSQIRNGQSNYDYLVSNYGPHLLAMGYGTTNESAVHSYWNECKERRCLFGPAFLTGKTFDQNQDNANGSPLHYAPHVTPSKSTSARVYVSASLPKALRRFRTKQGWEYYYGWNRQYGKRSTVCIIDSKFWPLIGRVGCANAYGDQNDLGSTLVPLQIRTVYEVTWNSPNLHDSVWRKILEDGNWIPHANTHVSGYNAVNAAH